MEISLEHFKSAVESVYLPLKIECWEDDDGCGEYTYNFTDLGRPQTRIIPATPATVRYFDYSPPFYLDDKCNEMGFGVTFPIETVHYPVTCTSSELGTEFTVLNSGDWINHVDKFVVWSKKIRKLFIKIRDK
jgi:hypothetical protein